MLKYTLPQENKELKIQANTQKNAIISIKRRIYA